MFAPSTHPVATALAVAHGELDDLADVALFGLSDAELEDHQETVSRLANRVAELELRLIAESAGRGLDTKATLVRRTGQSSAVVHRRIRLGASLQEHEPVRASMTTGVVSEAQASEILAAVHGLPNDLDPQVHLDAERALVTLAAVHDERHLKVLGKKILDVVAPDIADHVAGVALQREHDQATQSCRLTLTDDEHGRCHLRGHVPTHVGAMLKRNLLALQAPKHVRATGQDCALTRRPGPERLGRAFCELVERYPVAALPHAGGVQARTVVTLDHHQLVGALGSSTVATIDSVPIPAGVARRLACEAGILPAVLVGTSQPLDVGRTKRFHTTAQRIALNLRDTTCTAEGCDWPAALCHAHHDTPWSKGGSTSVADGRLLCPHHHQLAHHPTWQMTKTKHGQVTFLRR